ncbi:hypothetical protein PoB_000903700 [Plakobranchus ocellatus]|uniref:Uncharacterized protein n=1 Tax=Plakobranchus ocellatus TaxID=259542 RepID=A0AAV3YI54_9GAST|nr:hypothetical protein PoB_000903700 [Plakobranchus ocellatus]
MRSSTRRTRMIRKKKTGQERGGRNIDDEEDDNNYNDGLMRKYGSFTDDDDGDITDEEGEEWNEKKKEETVEEENRDSEDERIVLSKTLTFHYLPPAISSRIQTSYDITVNVAPQLLPTAPPRSFLSFSQHPFAGSFCGLLGYLVTWRLCPIAGCSPLQMSSISSDLVPSFAIVVLLLS